MSIIGTDNREVVPASSLGTFPYSTVVALDIIPSKKPPSGGSGITLGPNHVLTAAHNVFDRFTRLPALRSRATTSANENSLISRVIGVPGDPADNVVKETFLADNFSKTRALQDDIALLTTSNLLLPATDVIGIVAFADPEAAKGLTITTAGYPSDNVENRIPGNTGMQQRDLVRSPRISQTLDPSGRVVNSIGKRRFSLSSDIDAVGGQSGSGIWHTVSGDSIPRVLGVYTRWFSIFGLIGRNDGVLITTDIYDQITSTMEADSGSSNAKDLPENAIIGGDNSDEIFESYRKERILGQDGDDRLLGGGEDDRLEGGSGVDQALFSGYFTDYDLRLLTLLTQLLNLRMFAELKAKVKIVLKTLSLLYLNSAKIHLKKRCFLFLYKLTPMTTQS